MIYIIKTAADPFYSFAPVALRRPHFALTWPNGARTADGGDADHKRQVRLRCRN
jgi:hypothetical protein